MSSNKTLRKKIRIRKRARQTKWAPVWVIPKVFGVGRRVHPFRITRVKRSWRRQRIN